MDITSRVSKDELSQRAFIIALCDSHFIFTLK